MSLLTYEFNRADNAGEISQFRATLPIMQKHYQGRNEVVLYLSGKLNTKVSQVKIHKRDLT